jgi:Fur family transcriptional regulator, ferric uptake regulator
MKSLAQASTVLPDWPAQLHGKGLRATQATLLVLQLLQEADVALSHEELERRIAAHAAQSKPDRVTLYRILERLSQVGMLRKISHADRTWRFAVATQDEAGTFECDSCHRLTPLVQDAKLSEAMALIGSYLKAKGTQKGAQAKPSFLNAHGICASCAD